MSKISSFVVGTLGLSLAILLPVYLSFQMILAKIEELGLATFPNFWQSFLLIVFVVVIADGTLMALLVFGGERSVLR